MAWQWDHTAGHGLVCIIGYSCGHLLHVIPENNTCTHVVDSTLSGPVWLEGMHIHHTVCAVEQKHVSGQITGYYRCRLTGMRSGASTQTACTIVFNSILSSLGRCRGLLIKTMRPFCDSLCGVYLQDMVRRSGSLRSSRAAVIQVSELKPAAPVYRVRASANVSGSWDC